jgi:NAD(P)-dependent dehydrogenase (short-subunit alcohol dehydrogenase family)
MTTPPWTPEQLPDFSDRTVIVTGGNSGIGLEAARELARKGAHVVLACRDLGKARAAIEGIRKEHSGASLDAMELDLANLASVRAFAKAFLAGGRELHVLCNNAGVMALPYRRTSDGFEMQFGTNHLGHFALTGLVLERLLETPGGRVVTVSSGAHRPGRMRFSDLQSERGYRKWRAYAQSKLANLLFAYELQRRLERKSASLISVACHPGYAATNLQRVGPRMRESSFLESISNLGNRLLAQSAAMGALPTLYAAAAPDVRGGDYIGPDGFGEIRGHPRKVDSSARSRDPGDAARLWEVSEALTGVRYEALAS